MSLSTAVERALRALQRELTTAATGEVPVVRLPGVAEVARRLDLRRWLGGGGMGDAELESFLDEYLAASTHLHHPGYLAHQVAAPAFSSVVADLVNGATNNGMAIYEMGPAAVAVELTILDWMLEKVGWQPSRWPGDADDGVRRGAGVLTHGGSLANLTALLAARAAIAPAAWEQGTPGDLAVLAPPSAHYSVARAIAILGLGHGALYDLEADELDRVEPAGLERARRRAAADGKRVMAVVASACATGTGLHDPLAAMGAWCREHGIWLHVDAAHGASALVSPVERHKMAGIELADSLIWDAHKMLGTSALCTAVLVRDAATLAAAFKQEASYLFYGAPGAAAGVDLIHRTVECTKAPLGLKLFLNLAMLGEPELAGRIDATYALARRFHAMISARPGFESPCAPEANIVCFRHTGRGADLDARQIELRAALLKQGDFYLSSAEVAGRRYLRVVIMNQNTDEAALGRLLDAVERLG